MPSGRRGAFARGTSARLNPCFCASASRSSPNGTGRISPVSPSSPNTTRSCGTGFSVRLETTASATARSAAVSPTRKPPTMFANTSLSPDANPQCRCNTASNSPRRCVSNPCASRRGDCACVAIDERLNLHQHGPRALASHERDAAGHRRRVSREEDRRRILDLAKALLAHHEEAHLVRGAETILDRAHDSKTAAEIALEIQHGVDHVLEHARTRERALLRHVTDEQRRHVVRLREAHELRGALAHLAHGARRRLQLLAEQRLDRIDREHAEPFAGHASQDRLDAGLGRAGRAAPGRRRGVARASRSGRAIPRP